MHASATNITTLVSILRARIGTFLFVFFLVFSFSYLLLYSFGIVPSAAVTEAVLTEKSAEEAVAQAAPETEEVAPERAIPTHTEPVSITIDALNRTISVENPTSRAVADLDAALLSGVVRHPDSARFGEPGTMLILGHSSYLPSVRNQNFKAFNGIQKLAWGDTIRVRSADTEYVYQVEEVYEAKASDVEVSIADTGARLTLATCDSFGTKDDRYIVEARLLYSEPIARNERET